MIETQDFIVPNWPAPPGVRAIFTTRRGGISKGVFASLNLGAHVGDDPAAVSENRRRVDALLPANPIWLNQVHGIAVHTLSNDVPDVAPVADASVTLQRNRPCAVLVADCLPILFCDTGGTCVAATHAGWHGLAAGVIERTVEAMPVAPQNLIAWMGPAIGAGAFEVGQDVVEAFTKPVPASRRAFQPIVGRNGKYLADIFALARQRLASTGVEQVFGGGDCTFSAPERFFSHRRDGRSGRMAAIIWRD